LCSRRYTKPMAAQVYIYSLEPGGSTLRDIAVDAALTKDDAASGC
jgi:hypothetical protein